MEKTTITGGMSGVQILGYFCPPGTDDGRSEHASALRLAKNSSEAKKSNIGMFIGEILVFISIIAVVTQAAKLYPAWTPPPT